jgi:hypothetical protein
MIRNLAAIDDLPGGFADDFTPQEAHRRRGFDDDDAVVRGGESMLELN